MEEDPVWPKVSTDHRGRSQAIPVHVMDHMDGGRRTLLQGFLHVRQGRVGLLVGEERFGMGRGGVVGGRRCAIAWIWLASVEYSGCVKCLALTIGPTYRVAAERLWFSAKCAWWTMDDSYKVKSTSRSSARVEERELSRTETTRKVVEANLHDNPNDADAACGRIVATAPRRTAAHGRSWHGGPIPRPGGHAEATGPVARNGLRPPHPDHGLSRQADARHRHRHGHLHTLRRREQFLRPFLGFWVRTILR